MNRPAAYALSLLLAALAAAPARSQPAPGGRAPRPTVGLVLSGGSAKGLTHVGVIRAVEEAGLPVDVVTGTSMGAIVGGLYATGYSVDSLDAIVRTRDWASLFNDAVDRRLQAPEDRLSEGAALVSLPVRDGRLTLPTGLVSGQGVFELLARLTWPVQDVRDFRQLPRPFAAVVVDAQTGAPVRLDSGYLPLAIRASMSIPSLFTPTEIDGRRYLDGGLARNLPAEDAVALGADVLVCADVSKTIDDLTQDTETFFDIIVNAAFYQSDRSLPEQQALCDVLIEPDLEGLSAFAFDAGAEWIARGEAAGRAKRAELEALAARVGAGRAERPSVPAEPAFRAEAVVVRGASGLAERVARERLALELPAELTAADVERAVRRVYATGAFDLVTYRVVGPEADGAARVGGRPVPTLVLDVTPATGDRVGFGFRYDSQYNAALLFTLQLRDLARFGSTTRLDARLGEQTQLRASAFARLGFEAPWSVAGRVGYTSVPLAVFGGLDRPAASGRLDVASARVLGGPVLLGTVLTGIGPAASYVRAAPDVAPDSVEGQSWTYAALSAFAAADTRDRIAFPSRGGYLLATAEGSPGLGASFRHVSLDARAWRPVAPGLSVGGRAAATRAWGSDVPADQFGFVGGAVVPALLPGRFFALYGVDTLELAGPASQLLAASVQAEPLRNLFVRATANAGRAGAGWSLRPDDWRAGAGLTLGAATPAGPVELTLDTDFESTLGVTVSLGRSF